MGRKKIAITRISDERNRQVCCVLLVSQRGTDGGGRDMNVLLSMTSIR